MPSTAATPPPASEAMEQGDAQTHVYHLDNGLKIVVREDHRAPVVVSQVWYKVGSSYEPPGITGISHLLEHMMFNGTKNHPPGEFSKIISANGGRENAFTGEDYTAYFQQIERSRLKVSFELEADRMRNLIFTPEEFAKERQVVMEERRMRTDDNPNALTQEQFSAAAFTNSGYQHPVIGWMNDIEAITIDDLRNWYHRWYAPNNATVVVVGDVTGPEVLKLAQQYFSPVPANDALNVRPPAVEPEQNGRREVVVKAPAKLPYLLMGYKTPALHGAKEAWEPYALQVLAGILDGGDSARFARDLVRGSQIASQVDAGYDISGRLPGLFVLDGTPNEGKSVTDLERALTDQVKALQDQPISDSELDRVKAQVIAEDVYDRDSVFYQAMKLGMYETVGLSWRDVDNYVDNIRKVTAEQVQAVARKYLTEDHLTVAGLVPLPMTNPDRGAMPMTGPIR
ncbi:MAG: insulinase family protein [Gammaproteobacteria bacterium]|nr:insulinase family protein [Gammaproteobacteria bacterium]